MARCAEPCLLGRFAATRKSPTLRALWLAALVFAGTVGPTAINNAEHSTESEQGRP